MSPLLQLGFLVSYRKSGPSHQSIIGRKKQSVGQKTGLYNSWVLNLERKSEDVIDVDNIMTMSTKDGIMWWAQDSWNNGRVFVNRSKSRNGQLYQRPAVGRHVRTQYETLISARRQRTRMSRQPWWIGAVLRDVRHDWWNLARFWNAIHGNFCEKTSEEPAVNFYGRRINQRWTRIGFFRRELDLFGLGWVEFWKKFHVLDWIWSDNRC